MIDLREIFDPNEKTEICNNILRALPDWFGIESSIVEYCNEVKTMPFFAARNAGEAIGFVAVKVHNPHTAEVYVMGIKKEFHRHGIGRQMILCCEEFCRENRMEFLTVKTLDESNSDEGYEKTRRFYLSLGFKPLEVFPLLWDENNPCLFLAKHLS